MKKLAIALVAVLALAAPVLAGTRVGDRVLPSLSELPPGAITIDPGQQGGHSSPIPYLRGGAFRHDDAVVVVVTPEHRMSVYYGQEAWGRYAAIEAWTEAGRRLVEAGADVDPNSGHVILPCRRIGADALTLEAGQGGYAAFCR